MGASLKIKWKFYGKLHRRGITSHKLSWIDRELSFNCQFFWAALRAKIFCYEFRVEDSLIFMCAAYGKKYGSFPLKKLQLSVSKSWLRQIIYIFLP